MKRKIEIIPALTLALDIAKRGSRPLNRHSEDENNYSMSPKNLINFREG